MVEEMTMKHQGKQMEFQHLIKRLTLDPNKQGSMMEIELPTQTQRIQMNQEMTMNHQGKLMKTMKTKEKQQPKFKKTI